MANFDILLLQLLPPLRWLLEEVGLYVLCWLHIGKILLMYIESP